MRSLFLVWIVVLTLFLTLTRVEGRKLKIDKKDVSDKVFSIEEFGLVKGGYIKVEVPSFSVNGVDSEQEFVGLVIVRTETEGSALEVLRMERMRYTPGSEETNCPYKGEAVESQVYLDFTADKAPLVWEHELSGLNDEGLYR